MPTKNVERIRALVMKEMAGEKLDPSEKAELDSWLEKSANNKEFHQGWKDWPAVKEKLKTYAELSEWHDQRPFALPSEKSGLLRRFNGYWLAAASVLVICVVVILYVELQKVDKTDGKYAENAPAKNNLVQPARQQAILTVTGGNTYVLDSLKDGQQIDGAMKSQNGSLEYLASSGKPEGEHSVTTPPGGFYNLVLSDGSHVWLNAASELSYKPSFPGDARKVRLRGEAYFLVSKDKSKPFIVETNSGDVQVYGTSFNVKSYEKEKMVTTLGEGSVAVKNNVSGESRTMRPGNQVRITPGSKSLTFIDQADVRGASGWKDGLFWFDGTELSDVLNELARWYNVTIEYKNKNLPKSSLTGSFDRALNLQELITYMQPVVKVRLSVVGNTLSVE